MAQQSPELNFGSLPDRVAETFVGKTVLITGGTGFIGKVLVEKLLRKCPGIQEIVLLVRMKKGKSPTERLKDIFSNPLFDKLKEMRGGVEPLLEKMKVVAGDITEPDLDLQAADRLYVQEHVDIIIHGAASVRFDDALKKAIIINVRGTKLVLELGRQCKKLSLFVHISTAYCHLEEKLLEEKAYPPPADPHKVIATAELLDEDSLESMAQLFLKSMPNSYAFTKALSEELAVEAMKDMPLLILRPSIVIPIVWEPVPGWTDNINGPTGILIGAGKGVIRSMYCQGDSYADYIPVDIFISCIMVAVWNHLSYGDTHTTICNVTSSAEVKMTWEQLIQTGKEVIRTRVPFNGVVWYPGGTMKRSRLSHKIHAVLFHWIPAVLVDALLVLLRYDPVLMRVQRRISKGFDVFEYFTNNQWDFKSDVIQLMRLKLNEREKKSYKIDAAGFDIPLYMEHCVRAARLYILKEPEDTIPAAKRHMKVMRAVDIIFRLVFVVLIFWLLFKYTSTIFGAPVQRMLRY